MEFPHYPNTTCIFWTPACVKTDFPMLCTCKMTGENVPATWINLRNTSLSTFSMQAAFHISFSLLKTLRFKSDPNTDVTCCEVVLNLTENYTIFPRIKRNASEEWKAAQQSSIKIKGARTKITNDKNEQLLFETYWEIRHEFKDSPLNGKPGLTFQWPRKTLFG